MMDKEEVNAIMLQKQATISAITIGPSVSMSLQRTMPMTPEIVKIAVAWHSATNHLFRADRERSIIAEQITRTWNVVRTDAGTADPAEAPINIHQLCRPTMAKKMPQTLK